MSRKHHRRGSRSECTAGYRNPCSPPERSGNLPPENQRKERWGVFIQLGHVEVAMRTFLIAVATIFLLVGGGVLVKMNNACKTSLHSWCRPHISDSGSGHQKRLPNGSPRIY